MDFIHSIRIAPYPSSIAVSEANTSAIGLGARPTGTGERIILLALLEGAHPSVSLCVQNHPIASQSCLFHSQCLTHDTMETPLPKKPWSHITRDALTPAQPIYTMLSFEEQQMLYHYAATCAPHGALLDLGSHLGGSAARMILGAKQTCTRPDIHLFDRFQFLPEIHADRVPFSKWHDDGAIMVKNLLATLSDDIHLHQGDIREAQWDDTPIALLFVDIAKSAAILDHIAANFYPALIAGQSILIQQEYLYPHTPWVAVHMELWADKFERIAQAEKDSAVFRLMAPISREDTENRHLSALSEADFMALLRRAGRTHPEIQTQLDLINEFGLWHRTRTIQAKLKKAGRWSEA